MTSKLQRVPAGRSTCTGKLKLQISGPGKLTEGSSGQRLNCFSADAGLATASIAAATTAITAVIQMTLLIACRTLAANREPGIGTSFDP